MSSLTAVLCAATDIVTGSLHKPPHAPRQEQDGEQLSSTTAPTDKHILTRNLCHSLLHQLGFGLPAPLPLEQEFAVGLPACQSNSLEKRSGKLCSPVCTHFPFTQMCLILAFASTSSLLKCRFPENKDKRCTSSPLFCFG